MKLRHVYLIFCLLGLLLPYSQFVPWIMEHHALNMPLFVRDLFANRISAFFAFDVIVSAVVLISFIHTEGKRLGDASSLVANDRHIADWRFAWIPALPLSATTQARSSRRLVISAIQQRLVLATSLYRQPHWRVWRRGQGRCRCTICRAGFRRGVCASAQNIPKVFRTVLF